MAKHTITGFITHTQYSPRSEVTIDFRTYRPTAEYSPHTVVVSEHSFEVEVPDNFDPRPEMVALLEEQKRVERKKFAARVKELDQQIQSLLAIEMTVDA